MTDVEREFVSIVVLLYGIIGGAFGLLAVLVLALSLPRASTFPQVPPDPWQPATPLLSQMWRESQDAH